MNGQGDTNLILLTYLILLLLLSQFKVQMVAKLPSNDQNRNYALNFPIYQTYQATKSKLYSHEYSNIYLRGIFQILSLKIKSSKVKQYRDKQKDTATLIKRYYY